MMESQQRELQYQMYLQNKTLTDKHLKSKEEMQSIGTKKEITRDSKQQETA